MIQLHTHGSRYSDGIQHTAKRIELNTFHRETRWQRVRKQHIVQSFSRTVHQRVVKKHIGTGQHHRGLGRIAQLNRPGG